jgi:hypothetical protein
MPFKSESQRRLFWAKVNRGEISKEKALEWEHETKKKHLPEKVKASKTAHIAYTAGCAAATSVLFGKSAAEDMTAHPPDDAAAALPIGGGNPEMGLKGLSEQDLMQLMQALQAQQGAEPAQQAGEGARSSADFAEFAQQDSVDEDPDSRGATTPPAGGIQDKTPNWSGNNSLEGGDVGTRSYQMGLPRFGGV